MYIITALFCNTKETFSIRGILDILFRSTAQNSRMTASFSRLPRHTGKIYGARRNKFYPVSPKLNPGISYFLVIFCCLIFCNTNTHAQQNNTLRGKILYLNSGKQPATGVKIAGTVKGVEIANVQYTTSNGSFELVFPAKRDGHQVNLVIGAKDQLGQAIEVVNDKEVDICRIPAIASDEFEIIVCPKGARDTVAQRYYKIIKSSSDAALAQKKQEFNELLNAQQKDYDQITNLSKRITQLEKQADSVKIYRTAWRIASINKDKANERVLKYQAALDQGKTVQEALEHLSIALASKQVDKAANTFKEAIEELELCAEGSMSIFDYNSAMACYDTIIVRMEGMDMNPLSIADYYYLVSTAALDGGKFKKALTAGNKTTNIREAILDSKHPEIAASYSNIGITYQSLGAYVKALEFQEKAIAIFEEILDPKYPNIAATYTNIGNTYQFLGAYDKALKFQEKAISILEAIIDPKHPDLAASYVNIGNTYKSLGVYEKALEFQKKAIVILEENLDTKHPSLAIFYNNIGNTYQSTGSYDKALEFQKKAIAIQEAILDPKHPDLTTSYTNIGNIYQLLGAYDKALEFQKRATSIQEEILDPKHPNIATSYNNISITYRSLGYYDKALKFQKKSISIRETILDSKHPDLATSYSNIGTTYQSLGANDKALEFQKKAIVIQEAIFDPEHPSLSISYNNIAVIYRYLKQYKKALEFQKKAIVILKAILDPKHPNLATSYNNIGSIYELLESYDKALEYHKKAIEIRTEIFDSKHPNIAISYGNISQVHLASGNNEKALEFIKKAIHIFKDVLPKDHPIQQKIFNGLIEIYLKKKDFTKALASLKASNEEKENSENWNYIGRCHYHLKEYPKAIEAYKQAVSLSPEIKSQNYYNNIGTSYVKNKQFREAKEAFQAYEKLFPNEGRPQRNWAMYYALQNENNKALTHLQKAIDLGFDDLEWLKTDDSMDGLRKELAFMALVEQLEKANIDNQKNK